MLREWAAVPLRDLTEHLASACHTPMREEMRRLERVAARAIRLYRQSVAEMESIHALSSRLSSEATKHMNAEETALFPAIRDLDRPEPSGFFIAVLLPSMTAGHARISEMLAELRRLTGHYAVPPGAPVTIRVLYRRLEHVETSLLASVNLENHVLFPRTLARIRGVKHPWKAI
jgi:regulator of cell morphogenesis and NO signaling